MMIFQENNFSRRYLNFGIVRMRMAWWESNDGHPTFLPSGTQTALHQEPYATNMSRNGSSWVCFLYPPCGYGLMTTKRMMHCQIAKKKCLPSLFPIFGILTKPQPEAPAEKKKTSKCAAMLGALVSGLRKSDLVHIPRLKGCVSMTKLAGKP